jgi:hypothetical protein
MLHRGLSFSALLPVDASYTSRQTAGTLSDNVRPSFLIAHSRCRLLHHHINRQ